MPQRKKANGSIWALAAAVAVTLATTAALTGAIAGGVLAARMVVGSAATTSSSLGPVDEAAGLHVQVDSAEWLSHEMQGMPRALMPGMPSDGHRRLRIQLTLHNLGADSGEFGPQEFRLSSTSGEPWPPMASSLVATSLTPGSGISGALFFDVPDGASELRLIWARGGAELHLPAGFPGANQHDDVGR